MPASPFRFPLFPALLALAALPGAAGAAPAAADDGALTGVGRIVAVGDIHGDYGQCVKVLRAAQVIDTSDTWIAGATHLVQLGDVLDRGPDSRPVMDLLMKLEGQAAKAGGCVHALLGNHEAMVLSGRLAYLTPEELASYGGHDGLKRLFGPDGTYGKWIRGHDAVVQIDGVLFVHGGLSPAYATRPLRPLNEAIRRELKGEAPDAILHDPDGPLWYRGLAEDDDAGLERQLKPALDFHGASRIVIGHTVSKGAIALRGGGRVLMIDVGMSRVYHGPAACLVIEKGKYREVSPEGTRELPVRVEKEPAPGPSSGLPCSFPRAA
jgi:hypothetical protein